MRRYLWLKKQVEKRNLLPPVQRESASPGTQGRRAPGVRMSGLGPVEGAVQPALGSARAGPGGLGGCCGQLSSYTHFLPHPGVQAVSCSLLKCIKVFILLTCNVD